MRGVATLHVIDGTMVKWGYFRLPEEKCQSALKMGFMSSYMFQQDVDPKHMVELCKQWVIWKVPKQLKTPVKSPNLNPTVHFWAHLKIRVHSRNLQSKQDLKRIVTEEWRKIDRLTCKNLVNSMQSICTPLIKSRSYSSRY